MLNIPHGAYHLLTDDIRRQREMANSDIAPHAGIWKTMMHNKHSSFLVKLTIHDITNVPLVSGSFSVRWKFRGSKGDLDLAPTATEPTTSTRSKESTSPLDRSFTGALTGRNERDEVHQHLPDPSSSSTGFSRSSPESSIYPSPSSTGTSTPAMVPGSMSSSHNVREPSLHNGLASHNKTQSQSSAETQSTMASSQHQHQHQHHHHPHLPGHHHGQTPTGPNVLSLSSRPSVQSLLDKEIASTLLPLPSNVTHNNASASSSRRRHHRDGDDHDQDDPHGVDDGQHPGPDQNGRSKTAHLHVPHILLHRSENTSHTSLSSAFSGLSRKKRGAADSVESGSMLRGSGRTGGRQRVSSLASSIDSVPESLRSTGSKSTAEHPPEEVKLDVPLGTVTTVKGRTPIQELEDHGASWEHHVAQIVRIKLRPMDEDAASAYAKRTGKELKVPSGNSNGTIKEPHGRARQVGASLMGGSKDAQQSSSEPAGWLGGGAKSESGLKLVVYQHLAGMGLETIRSVSTRSEGNEDGDDGQDHGSISSKTSTAKPGRQRHGLRNHSQKHGHHEHDHPGIYFGELNLDLAEYASEEARMGKGGVTRRYLLKGGKTNAMIKMTIELSHYGGETNFVTPPLQRGHNVAGLAAVTENDIQLEHHLANLKAPHNSASSSSVSLAQSQSSMLDRSRDQLLRTVSSATIPLTEQSRVRPKKPPESHFVAPEHQHRFNQLYRRGYRNHGHRAVHDALKMGHREHRHRHRSSGAYSGEWSAEQVIDLIFNPLPVNRIERVTPFTYYAEDAPDDAESVIRVDMEDGAEARVETASIADSTGTIHEKRPRKFLSVLSGHGLRSNSNIPTPKDEHSEKDKGLGAVNGSGAGGKARPKWGRNKTKMNES